MKAKLFMILTSAGSACCLSSPLGPVVDLGYAAFAGNTTSPTGTVNSSVAFFGAIPYAKPPLGNLRFRAPQQLDEKTRTRSITDARNWGPPCIQRPAVVGIGSEDCLTLNVWKPSNATEGDKLPVAVYIHGGGFYYGTPQGFPMYDWVAQQPNGLVAASITYRLGLWGFLGGSNVAADGALNAGLLDQRAGLEWVQRHISKFGGDPDNVTIYGESAGGASVVMQVVAYAGTKKAPFNRAVAQSIGFGPTSTQSQVDTNFRNAATYAGCSPDDLKVMDCLRSSSVGALVSATNRTPNGAFAPIIDGPSGFLPDLPSRLIQSGKFAPVDLISGHCTGDGRTFAGGRPDQFQTEADVRRLVFARWPGVSNDTITRALELYPDPSVPGSPFATQYDRAWTMAGEIIFTCMDWLLAEANLTKGKTNIFAYSWDAPDTVLYDANPYLGAMHTSDLYYLFDGTNTIPNAGNTFKAFNSSESVLSREAIAYWTTFAVDGDPNSQEPKTWPVFGNISDVDHDRLRLRFVRGDAVKTASVAETLTPAEKERCMFWMDESVTAQTRV